MATAAALVEPAVDGRRVARSALTGELVARALAGMAAPANRPALPGERLSGVHNPWGVAASRVDAWAFLDLCQTPDFVAAAAAIAGPDLILWDCEIHRSVRDYAGFVASGREGRYWPADPLAGVVVLVPLVPGAPDLVLPVPGIAAEHLAGLPEAGPLAVVRIMAATSRYRRDLAFAPNRIAMEEQVLLNYMQRPLWLISGADAAGNDFATGFSPSVARWAASPE